MFPCKEGSFSTASLLFCGIECQCINWAYALDAKNRAPTKLPLLTSRSCFSAIFNFLCQNKAKILKHVRTFSDKLLLHVLKNSQSHSDLKTGSLPLCK